MPSNTTNRRRARERVVRTENYAQQVGQEYANAVDDILALKKTLPGLERGVMYSFAGDTRIYKQVERILRELHSATLATIKAGIEAEWETANKEVDSLITSVFGQRVLSNKQLAGWFDRNEKAMNAFINRTNEGMNLSARLWKNGRQFRDELEVAMTVAIGEGQSASQMSRRVRQYLNDPDLMFRRFRYKDEEGRWQRKWKKRVRDDDGHYHFIDYDRDSYHVGAGNYKSSYKNAMRLTRTETNMAYRNADHDRWNRLDFVRGQHIELSASHPEYDICDILQGDYPKEFIFEGWHPQCFCICTPILASEEDMMADLDAVMRGETYTPRQGAPIPYPEAFRNYLYYHREEISDAMRRGTAPYFVTHNLEIVENLIGEELPIRK